MKFVAKKLDYILSIVVSLLKTLVMVRNVILSVLTLFMLTPVSWAQWDTTLVDDNVHLHLNVVELASMIQELSSRIDSLEGSAPAVNSVTSTSSEVDTLTIKTLLNGSFAGIDMPNANLYRANLAQDNFSNANLSGLSAGESQCGGTNFSGANLQGANFSNSQMNGVNFNGADLTGASLTGCDFNNASFVNANFTNANVGGNLNGVNWTGANITGCTGCTCTDDNADNICD